MTRSYKKTPITGFAKAESEKQFKRIENRRRRAAECSGREFIPVSYGPKDRRQWHDKGDPYTSFAPTFNKLMNRTEAWATTNGVEFRRFRFHHLRHRHAVDWLKSGRDIYSLQGRLGHASIKTTEIYLEYLTPEEIQVAKFGARDASGDLIQIRTERHNAPY
jgi:integrase